MPETKRSSWNTLVMALNLGFTVIVSLLVPLFLGIWIGEKCGNRKMGALIGALLGLLTALGALWELIKARRKR